MARPPGTRNNDFAEARLGLLQRMTAAVIASPAHLSSFAGLAEAAGASRSTLRHYFGGHEDLLLALMAHWATLSGKNPLPEPAPRTADEALRRNARWLVVGWRHGLNMLLERGIQSGMGHDALGPAFVNYMLEPLLQTFERLIAAWQAEGQLSAGDPRLAAIELVAPLLVALLHQDSFRGARCRPLEIDALLEAHLDRFLRAWAPEVPAAPPEAPAPAEAGPLGPGLA